MELLAKLDEEKKKYEGLLDEKMDIDEKLALATKAYEETKERLKAQQEVIDKLKAQIEGQSKVTEDLNTKLDEEKKINKVEEERFRRLAQMNAALRAKLEFIQSKYDFTTNVNILQSDDFKQLMNSNDMVRIKVTRNLNVGEPHDEGFCGQAGGHKDRGPEVRGTQVQFLNNAHHSIYLKNS